MKVDPVNCILVKAVPSVHTYHLLQL